MIDYQGGTTNNLSRTKYQVKNKAIATRGKVSAQRQTLWPNNIVFGFGAHTSSNVVKTSQMSSSPLTEELLIAASTPRPVKKFDDSDESDDSSDSDDSDESDDSSESQDKDELLQHASQSRSCKLSSEARRMSESMTSDQGRGIEWQLTTGPNANPSTPPDIPPASDGSCLPQISPSEGEKDDRRCLALWASGLSALIDEEDDHLDFDEDLIGDRKEVTFDDQEYRPEQYPEEIEPDDSNINVTEPNQAERPTARG